MSRPFPCTAVLAAAVLLLAIPAAAEEGTVLTMTYTVGGYAPDGLASPTGPVDCVLVQQMERLKAHVED